MLSRSACGIVTVWDEIEPAPNSLVHRSQAGLVVTCDDQLELWGKVEEILPHEAR
jgi:hypothetical protein